MPSCLSKSVSHSCHDVAHTWRSSCGISSIEIFYNCFRYAIQLYTPLYTVSALLSRRRKAYFMKKLFQEILQSSLFLASNGGLMVFFFCLLRKLLGKFYFYSAGLIPGVLCSFSAILIERKSRRGALAVYMLNQALDTSFNILKDSGYASNIQYGEVMLFAGTMSVLMYMYRSNNLPDGFIKTILKTGLIDHKQHTVNTNSNALSSERFGNNMMHVKHSCQLAGKAFIAGFALQTSYNILIAVPKAVKHPVKLLQALVRKENFKTGAFFGSFVGIYKIVEGLLTKYIKSDGHMNAAIAGGVAGLSMFFQRSSYIALYLVSKIMELIYMNGIEKGMLPYVKHFDSLLYALCTGLMFHAAVLQPLYLRPTYWNFLLKLTGKRFGAMDRTKLDVFGLDSSRIDRLV